MLNRIRAAIDAFRKRPPNPKELSLDVSKITPEQFAEMVEKGSIIIPRSHLGDGKAEFLGEGMTEEFEAQEKADNGQTGIFGIGL